MIKIKEKYNFSMQFRNVLIFLIAVYCVSDNVFSQSNQNGVSLAAGKTDNFITINKNDSYIIKFEISKETLVSIGLFDEIDKLSYVLMYEYMKPGILEYDLAKHLPFGNYTCKIIIGENTEVLKLIVI